MNLCRECFADSDIGEGHQMGCPNGDYAFTSPYDDDDELICCGQFYDDGVCCGQPYRKEELEQKDDSV